MALRRKSPSSLKFALVRIRQDPRVAILARSSLGQQRTAALLRGAPFPYSPLDACNLSHPWAVPVTCRRTGSFGIRQLVVQLAVVKWTATFPKKWKLALQIRGASTPVGQPLDGAATHDQRRMQSEKAVLTKLASQNKFFRAGLFHLG